MDTRDKYVLYVNGKKVDWSDNFDQLQLKARGKNAEIHLNGKLVWQHYLSGERLQYSIRFVELEPLMKYLEDRREKLIQEIRTNRNEMNKDNLTPDLWKGYTMEVGAALDEVDNIIKLLNRAAQYDVDGMLINRD